MSLRHVIVKPLPGEHGRRPRWVRVSAVLTVTSLAVTLGLIVFLLNRAAPSTPSLASPPASSAPATRPAGTTGPDTTPPSQLSAPIADLNSGTLTTRLGGIAALQQYMNTSPSDQPAVLRALCAFIRTQSPAGASDQPITTDIQAALTAIGTRNPAHDGNATVDLHAVNATDAKLGNVNLAGSTLTGIDLTDADLTGANFSNSDLSNAYVGGASLTGTNLGGANLDSASFYGTPLCTGSTPIHPEDKYNCTP